MDKRGRIPANRTKILSAICVSAICICLILGTTYSWFTTRDSVDNHFKTPNLDTSIYEVYVPQKSWTPEIPVQKEVGVINNGTTTVFVRVSLSEYLLMLETGQWGHPTVQNLGGMSVADLMNPAEWSLRGGLAVPAFTYTESGIIPMENENGPLYYKAANILKSINFSSESGRNSFIEEYIEIGWGNGLGVEWYFNSDDEYFYYMKPLPSGGSTSRLVKTVRLRGDYPVSLQFAPYFIEVRHQSIAAGADSLTQQWGIADGSFIFDNLVAQLE